MSNSSNHPNSLEGIRSHDPDSVAGTPTLLIDNKHEDSDTLGYKRVSQLVKSLERIDDIVIEAAQDALWYRQKSYVDMTLPIDGEDLKRLEYAHGVYSDGCAMDDMLKHVSKLRDEQTFLDRVIASIVRFMARTVKSNFDQWVDWYERLQKAGDQAWRDAIVSAHWTKADMNNALADKFVSLDRVLDLLKKHLSLDGERTKFNHEYRDTLSAVIAIQASGPYAPLSLENINKMKSELRRRKQIEERDLSAESVVAQIARPYVEEEEIALAQPAHSPPKPASQHLQKWNSTVTATVAILFAVMLAAIPGYKAWQYSPREPGTVYDADFWFLVQSCMMQLIGLMTIVLPLALSGRLALQRWFWTWLLFGVSLSCSIAPIPVYLYFPTEWSATITFLGSAAQAFVTLQALFLVHKEKIS